nr:hypothetical protein [Tanacetum cinerariifolium]
MELVPEPHKASEFAQEDVISTMPDNVITNILDRLHIKDAVKTGILSTDWRLLLHVKGPITKFVLDLQYQEILDDECMLDNMAMITSSSIFQLKLLPKLQELDLNFAKCKFLAEAIVDEKVPTIFPCLKTLTLSIVNFSSDGMLSFVMEMIRGSPKLQNLNITATYKGNMSQGNISRRALPSLDLDYNTIGQLHLQCVVFSSFRGTENEVCLIKYILACSPLLKSMAIILSSLPGGDSGKFKFAQKLLTLHRASPIAEIGLY